MKSSRPKTPASAWNLKGDRFRLSNIGNPAKMQVVYDQIGAGRKESVHGAHPRRNGNGQEPSPRPSIAIPTARTVPSSACTARRFRKHHRKRTPGHEKGATGALNERKGLNR